MPFTAGCYALATVAIMGLPPFSGFISKFLMITAAAAAGRVDVAALILVGSVVAAFYYLRVVRFLFFHPYEGPAVSEAPASMLAAMVILAAAIILGGVAPGYPARRRRAPSATSSPSAPACRRWCCPNLLIDWPAAAVIATVGAVAVWLLGKRIASRCGGDGSPSRCPSLPSSPCCCKPDRYDGLSFAFALLVAGVGTLNMAYATGYLAHHPHAQHRFYAAFSLMMAGLIGMAGSHDFFNFFAFWELMSSWALYVALVHEETDDARREAFKYFIFNTVGASFMFLGIAMFGSAQPAASSSPMSARPLRHERRLGRRRAGAGVRRHADEGGHAAGAHRLPDAPGHRADAGLRLHLGRAAEERPLRRAEAVRRCSAARRCSTASASSRRPIAAAATRSPSSAASPCSTPAPWRSCRPASSAC